MSSTITETPTLKQWMADPSRTQSFEVAHLWGLHTVRGRFRSFDGVYFSARPASACATGSPLQRPVAGSAREDAPRTSARISLESAPRRCVGAASVAAGIAQMCQSGEKPSEIVRRGSDRTPGGSPLAAADETSAWPAEKGAPIATGARKPRRLHRWEFGELVDVVVDPATRRLTHLVVEPRRKDWLRGSYRSTWCRPATMRVEQSSFG